jgi:ribose-phosphate pyrophosphokinase
MDVHNLSAFQNAFRCRTDHLEAAPLFVDYFAEALSGDEIAVVSPDVGGVKRAEQVREALAERLDRPVASGFMEKQRSRGVVSGDVFVGEVRGRSVVLLDDMISTGTTMVRAASACIDKGARRVFAVATHGLFVEPAEQNLRDGPFERVVVTDTVPPFRLGEDLVREKLVVLDAAPAFATAVERMESTRNVEDLAQLHG